MYGRHPITFTEICVWGLVHGMPWECPLCTREERGPAVVGGSVLEMLAKSDSLYLNLFSFQPPA